MRSRNFTITSAAVVGVTAIIFALSTTASKSADEGPALAQAGSPPPLPVPSADDEAAVAPPGLEVQTRGQVHEAFAQPLGLNPEPGPTVEKRPPDPIEEVPPDAVPEGENVVWIGGYWAWDDDRNDYLWISGIYRNVPKYQTWVAGYWSEVAGGYQWTPGFWATTANGEVNYIEQAPPQSLEAGPTTPQPSENQFWIPGNYVYRETRYLWQPGYWAPCQPNWVWVPAHWVWTPAGFVFVNGFWDYPVERRGCLFAPVYFSEPVYIQPAFVWTPRVLINIGLFNDCLFARPRFCHYYYGDYFAPQYATLGFRPWCSVGLNIGVRGGGVGFGYDPLFVYYNWSNSRRNPNWLAQTRRHFDQLRDNPAARPPHTFVAQQQLLAKADPARRNDLALASTIKQATKNPSEAGGVKLHQISQVDRQQFVAQGKAFKQATQERVKLEKSTNVTGDLAGSRTPGGLIGKDANNTGKKGGGDVATDRAFGTGGGLAADASKIKTMKLPTITPTKTTLAGDDAGAGAGTKGGALGRSNGLNLGPGEAGGRTGRSMGNNKASGQTAGDSSNALGDNTSGDRRFNALNQQNKGYSQDKVKSLDGNAISGPSRSFVAPRSGGLSNGGGNALGNPGGSNAAGATGTNGPTGKSGPTFQGPSASQRSFIQPGGGGGSPTGQQLRSMQAQPKFTPPTGGGGGSKSQKQDNDDPQKKKTSDIGSPRTDMNLMPPLRNSVDVRGTVASEQRALKQSSVSATDTVSSKEQLRSAGGKLASAPFSADDKLGDDSHVTRKSNYNSGSGSSLLSTPSLQTSGPFGANSANSSGLSTTVRQGDARKLSADRGSRVSGNTSLENNGAPTNGGSSGSNSSSGLVLRPGFDLGAARTSSASRYDYDSLQKRGQSLSLNSGLATGNRTSNTSGEDNQHRFKDPVGSFGLGGAGRTMYGPGGLSGPSAESGDSGAPRGSGSYISSDSLPTLPKFQRGGSFGQGNTPRSLSTPESRTYDPRTN